jgi:hypothetical protein
MKNSGLHIVPIDTNIVDTFSPPPLAPDQNPCAPSPTTPIRAQQWWCEHRIRPLRPVPIDTANRPLSTPPNGLRAAHVPTAFPAAPTHGCGYHCLQLHRCRRRVVHIIYKLIVISIVFSSFNNVDLLHSMSANGALWRPWDDSGRRGWRVHVFCLALAGFTFTCQMSADPISNQQPTTNPSNYLRQ